MPNFVDDTLFFGDGTTAIDFGPTGIMYYTEKKGRVLFATPDGQGGYNAPGVLLDLQSVVDARIELGLLGVAVDPDFSVNRHLFVFYSTSSDQRLVRYTLDAAGTSASNPVAILSGLPRQWTTHNGGDIHFRPGEASNIYISLGDDSNPGDAPSLGSLRGKMLRVDKVTGAGLTTNPYYSGGALTDARARIWAVGMRNPFRFAFHPTPNTPRSNVLYVSENGDATDKMAWVRAGSNGGWSTAGDGPFINVADPDHRVLFTGPASHIGIAVAATGAFSDGGAPVIYLSNWLQPSGGSIRRWRLTGAELDTATAIPADNGNPFVAPRFATSLRFGPDGALYYTSSGVGEATGGFYEVGRIRFVGGTPPVAAFTTSPEPPEGPFPLTVDFADGSSDSDGILVSRAWTFGDGTSSTATDPTHVYQSPGTYDVTLTVTDDDGLTDRATTRVVARSSLTLNLRGDVLDGSALDGRRRAGATQLRFYQRDGTPIVVPGGQGPQTNGIDVIDGAIAIDLPMSLTSPVVVVTAGEGQPDVAVQTVAFEVPLGPPAFTHTIRLTPSTTAIRGRVADTRGAPARVDLGIAREAPSSLYPVAGGRDYRDASPVAPTGVAHRVETDVLGAYYFPLRDPGSYFIDVVGDTGAEIYLATLADPVVSSIGDAVDLDVTVGLQDGGAGCDDLSALPETPRVDYRSQIQPLWESCIGCHKPNSPNGGGLDLTEANAYAALVGVPSVQVPGRALVAPGDPEGSYLLEKISCDNPQVGNRMRPGAPTTVEGQALVRDWIRQGARATADGPPVDAGVPDAPPDAGATSTDGGGPSDPTETRRRRVSGSACRCTGGAASPASGSWRLVLLGGLAIGGRWRNRRRVSRAR